MTLQFGWGNFATFRLPSFGCKLGRVSKFKAPNGLGLTFGGVHTTSGWWFQMCFIFIPIWVNDPIWLFFTWVVQPPTRHNMSFQGCIRYDNPTNSRDKTLHQKMMSNALMSVTHITYVPIVIVTTKGPCTDVFFIEYGGCCTTHTLLLCCKHSQVTGGLRQNLPGVPSHGMFIAHIRRSSGAEWKHFAGPPEIPKWFHGIDKMGISRNCCCCLLQVWTVSLKIFIGGLMGVSKFGKTAKRKWCKTINSAEACV